MNEKVLGMIIKVGIPTVVIAAAGVFTFKIVKGYKRQLMGCIMLRYTAARLAIYIMAVSMFNFPI